MSSKVKVCVVALGFASLVLGLADQAMAFSPYGPQELLVVPLERQHAFCVPTAVDTGCPRHTAAQWQAILQSDLNSWFGTETFGQTSWNVRVLADPNTSDGWWPAPHNETQYSGQDGFSGQPAPARDAGETITSQAIADGTLTVGELAKFHRFMELDDFHTRGGTTNSAGVPLEYNPVVGRFRGIPLTFGFITTATLAAEDSGDAAALDVIHHELSHQLGLLDLYSAGPCPLLAPGAPPDRHTGYDADCVGPWDHMAVDSPGNGYGAYSKLALWINPDPLGPAVQEISKAFSGTIALDPIEQPGGGKLVVEIPDDPGGAALARLFGLLGPYKGFMIECRRKLGNDSSIPAEGVLVSYIDPTRADHPEDVSRGSSAQTATTAILSNVGDTYRNTVARIAIEYAGPAPHDGCQVAINRSILRYGHYIALISRFAGLRSAIAGFGDRRSFSAFIGAGVLVNGPARGLAAATRARRMTISPIHAGRTATIRFSYANGGTATVRGGTATVSVTDPYTVGVCGSQTTGRRIGRVRLQTLAPGAMAIASVSFRPRTNGPIGIVVNIARSGKTPMQAGTVEQGAIAFASARRNRHGRVRPVTATIIVSSGKNCPRAVTATVEPLSAPPGWTLSARGLNSPLRPGEQRRVELAAQPPRVARAQAVDLPIAILSDAPRTSNRRSSPVANPPGAPAIVGGLDVLARVVVPGVTTSRFVLPAPPAPPTPVPYPMAPPPRQASTLTLTCPADAPSGATLTATGTLTPAPPGAQVTLTYLTSPGVQAAFTHTIGVDLDGRFRDSFAPPGSGAYVARASSPGDGTHLPAQSSACQFAVETPPR